MHTAGFSDVRIEARSLTARFANAQDFLAFELGFDPAVAPALRHLDRRDRQRVLDDLLGELSARLALFVEDGTLVLPMHAHAVAAFA